MKERFEVDGIRYAQPIISHQRRPMFEVFDIHPTACDCQEEAEGGSMFSRVAYRYRTESWWEDATEDELVSALLP